MFRWLNRELKVSTNLTNAVFHTTLIKPRSQPIPTWLSYLWKDKNFNLTSISAAFFQEKEHFYTLFCSLYRQFAKNILYLIHYLLFKPFFLSTRELHTRKKKTGFTASKNKLFRALPKSYFQLLVSLM